MAGSYETWSTQQLIARIQDLEQQITASQHTVTTDPTSPNAETFTSFPIPSPTAERVLPYHKPPKPAPKPFDASKYATRLIALKFAYLGQKYNGFEHHRNNSTPLPTIEEEVWKALVKTRLINPTPREGENTDYSRVDRKTFAGWDRDGVDVNWEGCEYSKCGRTDRGVSAFGQVIGVRVRSNRPRPRVEKTEINGETGDGMERVEKTEGVLNVEEEEQEELNPSNDLTDELPYIQLLNRVLPPDIRIYAWCPDPLPDFSARFSCKERRYKYFFTNPCFAPVPGSAGVYSTPDGSLCATAKDGSNSDRTREGWLDVDAMQEGCNRLIGLHDFRNFCKIDASKQLTNFKRRIFHASIDQVSPLHIPSFLSHAALSTTSDQARPKIYAFTLHGSAFLWHQVRSLIAILFLIGQRLESPSLISHLLDISANPTRPKYEMASDAPLVLWDCIFPDASEVVSAEDGGRENGYEDALEWIYVGDEGAVEPKSRQKGKGGQETSIGRGKWGRGGVVDDVWEVYRGNAMDSLLSGLLVDRIAAMGKATLDGELGNGIDKVGIAKGGPRVFDGGNIGRAKGNYVPVLQRERQEPVEVVNERYARRKGLDPNKGKGREGDGDE